MRAAHTTAVIAITCTALAIGAGHLSKSWAASLPFYTERISSLTEQRISPVPLPSAAVLFGSAALGLIAVGRQKRANGRPPPPR